MWSTFIVELSNIAMNTKTELKAGAIQAIARIIQIEVIRIICFMLVYQYIRRSFNFFFISDRW